MVGSPFDSDRLDWRRTGDGGRGHNNHYIGGGLGGVEILSPAGNPEGLAAAIKGGCDAVYLAGKSFGARAFAGNFTDRELEGAISYAHDRHVKVHVAVNTSILNREMDEAELDYNAQTRYITVGDVVSLTFRRHGVRPLLSVYDGSTERREMTDFAKLVEGEMKEVVSNPAGRITAEMADSIRRGIEGEVDLIRVEGEEDLALLPCLLYAEEGTVVVYGMPGRCMMAVEIDGAIRKRAAELVATMEELE